MSLNSVFGIAKSSLFAHQQALAVTSSNLANANNPAYTRQVVNFGSAYTQNRAGYAFGTGVMVKDIVRVRNNVTDIQIRNNNEKYYQAETKSALLGQIEGLFSEPSEYGLSNLFAEFFNTFDELAVDPTSTASRATVIQAAESISEKVKSIYQGLETTSADVKGEAKNTVDTINNLVEQIHVANKQIYEASVVGHYSNDLIDTRDALLDELSMYANINVNIDENNVANVSIGGVFAVDGLHHTEFSLELDNDRLRLVNNDGAGRVSLSGGSLKGFLDIYNEDIPNQQNTMEELVSAFMSKVNEVHQQGYTITDPARTGLDFFTSFSDGNLIINEDILDDANNIAISGDGTQGDNSIALLLADIKNEEILGGQTLTEKYSEFISGIANDINLQDQNAESYALVLDQLNLQKTEYSGVSTDEEMINVMQYQRSYDAAAKLISVADELLETLLTIV